MSSRPNAPAHDCVREDLVSDPSIFLTNAIAITLISVNRQHRRTHHPKLLSCTYQRSQGCSGLRATRGARTNLHRPRRVQATLNKVHVFTVDGTYFASENGSWQTVCFPRRAPPAPQSSRLVSGTQLVWGALHRNKFRNSKPEAAVQP